MDKKIISKLTLGTHQFFDPSKRMSISEIKNIISCANHNKINWLDTADQYGNTFCEQFIGEFCKKNNYNFKIATKIGQLDNFKTSMLQTNIDNCLKRLKKDALDICYFHSGSNKQFFNESYWTILNKNLEIGKIKKIGLSIKSSLVKKSDFTQVLSFKKYNITCLNIMFNPLFQFSEKIFDFCHENNIKIFIRVPFAKNNVFKISNKTKIIKKIKLIQNLNYENNILSWIKKKTNCNSIVFGVSKIEQLKKIIFNL